MERLTQSLNGPLIEAFPRDLRCRKRLGMKIGRHPQHQIPRRRLFRGDALFRTIAEIIINRGFKIRP